MPHAFKTFNHDPSCVVWHCAVAYCLHPATDIPLSLSRITVPITPVANSRPEKRSCVYQSCTHRHIPSFVDLLAQNGTKAGKEKGGNNTRIKGA